MPDIVSLLQEKRLFRPNPEFAKRARWSPSQVAKHRRLAAKSPERRSRASASASRDWAKGSPGSRPAIRLTTAGRVRRLPATRTASTCTGGPSRTARVKRTSSPQARSRGSTLA